MYNYITSHKLIINIKILFKIMSKAKNKEKNKKIFLAISFFMLIWEKKFGILCSSDDEFSSDTMF